MQVSSLGWEDPPEKEMATHSRILTWRTSWTEEPGGRQSTGLQEQNMTEHTAHNIPRHLTRNCELEVMSLCVSVEELPASCFFFFFLSCF